MFVAGGSGGDGEQGQEQGQGQGAEASTPVPKMSTRRVGEGEQSGKIPCALLVGF